jgi:hypothetical protein
MTRKTVFATMLIVLAGQARAADFATILYRMAGSIKADGYYSVLAIQCGAIDLNMSMHKFSRFSAEETGLSREDRFSVDTLYANGGTSAEHDLATNKTAACAKLTPSVLDRVRGLAGGTRLVLNPDWQRR